MVNCLLFFLGSCLGSFCALVAERIPIKKSILRPRSYCSFCFSPIKIYDLLPIFSWLLLKRRCRYCQQKIPCSLFLSEIIGGLTLFLSVQANGFSLISVYYATFGFMALTLALTDSYYLILEPHIFYFFCVLLLILFIFLFPVSSIHLWEAICIWFLLQSLCYFEKIGGGDCKLLVCWTFFLGLKTLCIILFISSLIGIIFYLWRYSLFTKRVIPFIPFLAIGIYCVGIFSLYFL